MSGEQIRKSSMSRGLQAAGLSLAGLAMILPALVQAQERGPVGPRLILDIRQLIETDSNYDLSLSPGGRSTYADTLLSLTFLDETPNQRLSLATSGALRASHGPGFGSEGSGFVRPSIAFAYGREGAGSSLDLNARAQETEIDFVRDLADLDDGGVIEIPDDISDLTGTGTRRSLSADVALRWRQDTPLGFGVLAGISDTSYHDASSTSLHDFRRAWLGVSAQMLLDKITSVNLDLRNTHYTSDDPLNTNLDTLTFSADLVREFPAGSLTGQAVASRTDEGNRYDLSIGGSREFPLGVVSASIGATHMASGHTGLIGGANLNYELPRSIVTASLQRTVLTDNDDSERLFTMFSLGLVQELTPRSLFSVDMFYAISDASFTGGQDVDTASLTATYSYDVTEDWGLNLGYRHRLRKEGGQPNVNSNAVFVSLGRSFEFRP